MAIVQGKWRPMFRCQLCGKLDTSFETVVGSSEEARDLTLHWTDVIRPNKFNQIPQNFVHFCEDGSMGCATFAGMKLLEVEGTTLRDEGD